MTHKEHAEKVYRELNRTTVSVPIDNIEEECFKVIAVALEKQRGACQSELEQQLGGILLTHPWMGCPDVRNAEVKINKEKEGKE